MKPLLSGQSKVRSFTPIQGPSGGRKFQIAFCVDGTYTLFLGESDNETCDGIERSQYRYFHYTRSYLSEYALILFYNYPPSSSRLLRTFHFDKGNERILRLCKNIDFEGHGFSSEVPHEGLLAALLDLDWDASPTTKKYVFCITSSLTKSSYEIKSIRPGLGSGFNLQDTMKLYKERDIAVNLAIPNLPHQSETWAKQWPRITRVERTEVVESVKMRRKITIFRTGLRYMVFEKRTTEQKYKMMLEQQKLHQQRLRQQISNQKIVFNNKPPPSNANLTKEILDGNNQRLGTVRVLNTRSTIVGAPKKESWPANIRFSKSNTETYDHSIFLGLYKIAQTTQTVWRCSDEKLKGFMTDLFIPQKQVHVIDLYQIDHQLYVFPYKVIQQSAPSPHEFDFLTLTINRSIALDVKKKARQSVQNQGQNPLEIMRRNINNMQPFNQGNFKPMAMKYIEYKK